MGSHRVGGGEQGPRQRRMACMRDQGRVRGRRRGRGWGGGGWATRRLHGASCLQGGGVQLGVQDSRYGRTVRHPQPLGWDEAEEPEGLLKICPADLLYA